MPVVNVHGQNINFPDNLTSDELNLAVSKAADQIKPRQGVAQKAMNLATMPMRGYGALAVGAENLIAHPAQPTNALLRAAEATKVGFKPSGFMESAANTIGQSVPLMPLGGALGAGGKVAQLGKAALLGGGLSAANQTAEEGKPTLGRTAMAAGLSALPVAGMQALEAGFPYVAGKFTKTAPEAFRNVTTKFKKTFAGTPEAIQSESSKPANFLRNAFKSVSDKINAKKEYLGMDMTTKEALAEAAATGGEPRSIGKIVKEYKNIQENSAPIIEKEVKSGLVGPQGEELTRIIKEKGITVGEKLRRLDDMVKDINKETQGSYTTPVYQTKNAIQTSAQKAGGASYRMIDKLKQQWGVLKNIESDMGTNLSDPVTAGKDIENIVRKTMLNPTKMTAGETRKIAAIEELEKVTGKKILEPLKNQIISSFTNENLSDFVPKGMLGKILLMKYWPEGIASFGLGSPKLMGKLGQAIYNPAGATRLASRAITPTLASKLTRKNQ